MKKKTPTKKRSTKATPLPGKGMRHGYGMGPRDGSGPNPNCPKKKGNK